MKKFVSIIIALLTLALAIAPAMAEYGNYDTSLLNPAYVNTADGTRNFVRGALYFNFLPNNDSMQPVIDYIREDIDQMINTFEWK